MANIRLDAHEVAQLARAWQQAPQVVNDELRAAMYLSTGILHAETVDQTPVGASGGSGAGLAGSISYSVSSAATMVTGLVSTPNPYAIPVELGTKPHTPPLAPIQSWVEARLGIREEQAEAVAQRIVWKIKAKGTKGHFMFRNALERLTPDIEGAFRTALSRILQRLERGL